MANLAVYLIYLIVVVYALCYQLQAPVEPFLVSRLVGVDKSSEAAQSYGRLQGFFSALQALGSFLMGGVVDRFGVRFGLVLNFLCCALSYYLLSTVTTLDMLWLSKLPAMFMHGFLCSQTAMMKVTAGGSERVRALGRLTTAYTLGGVIGPSLGGLLGATGDYTVGARLATGGSLLAAVLTLFLPPSIEGGTNEPAVTSQSAGVRNWPRRVLQVFGIAGIFLFAKIVTGVANSMSRSCQPLILKDELHFNESDMGYFMSSQFGFAAFANAFLLGPVTTLMGGKVWLVVRNCIFTMAIGYFCQALLFSNIFFIGFKEVPFIMLAMGLSVLQYSMATAITAENSNLVGPNFQGTLMGIEHSLFAVAYAIGPSLGTTIFSQFGISVLSSVCGCIFFGVLSVWLVRGKPEGKLE